MSVSIPEGWEVDAIVSRVLSRGLCSYVDLMSTTLTLYDFYSMLRICDWQDYLQSLTTHTEV